MGTPLDVSETESTQWGFFRRPALFGPAVGFLAFLASEAIKTPPSGLGDTLVVLVPMLVVAIIFAAIPYLIGAFLLLVVFRVLPRKLVELVVARLLVGAILGFLIAWPFALVLNLIPSATEQARFDLGSMVVGCATAGGFCAVFFSETQSEPPSARERVQHHQVPRSNEDSNPNPRF